MKKNTIAFVMLLAATLLASSCSKSSDDPSPQPTPVQSADICFLTTVFSGQIEQISQTYTIDVDGVQKSFEISDMTELSDLKDYASYEEELNYALIVPGLDDQKQNLKTFKYDLGKLESGKVAKGVSVVYKAKENAPLVKEFDMLVFDKIYGMNLNNISTDGIRSLYYGGVPTEPETKRDDYLSQAAEKFNQLRLKYSK